MATNTNRRLVPVLFVAAIAVLVAWINTHQERELHWDDHVMGWAREYASTKGDEQQPLHNTIVVVTGATHGIGLALTRVMTQLGAHVIALGRSSTKLEALLKQQQDNDHGTITTVCANLEDLQQVANAANDILRNFTQIDILINNAGIHDGYHISTSLGGVGGKKNFTNPQGMDRVFVVNYLSHFLWTTKLMPLLEKSEKPVIMQISSSFHWAVDGLDLMPTTTSGGGDSSQRLGAAQPGGRLGGTIDLFRGQRSYANTKLAQIYHARALQQHVDKNVRIISVCPGWVATQIAGMPGSMGHLWIKAFGFAHDGWGVASALYGVFSSSNEDYYTNTRFFSVFAMLFDHFGWLAHSFVVRDVVCAIMAFVAGLGQRVAPDVVGTRSSPESYNMTIANALYDWSYKAIEEYL